MSWLRNLADAALDRRVRVRDVATGEELRLGARGALLACESGAAELADWSPATCRLLLRERERLADEDVRRVKAELAVSRPRIFAGNLREFASLGRFVKASDDIGGRFH